MNYTARLRSLALTLARKKLDALLVTHMPNIRYLCGFSGSSGVLVVSSKNSTFITDGRYTEQAREEVQGAKVMISQKSALLTAGDMLSRKAGRNPMSVGIESEHMTVSLRSAFKSRFEKLRLRDTAGLVEAARIVKDGDEIELIRKAVVLGSNLLEVAVKAIKPGVLETEVAAELEYAARMRGADAMSFETIVAAGPRSALPHGRASATPIPPHGFVVLDFGVILAGYCSDMTRTVHVGTPDNNARRMYQAVLESQLAGIDAVRASATAGDVDQASRSVLKRAKLDQYFTHSTGHGVGLEIHESPRLARSQGERLTPGMVVTIEPGVYVAGKGGIRIEDMVVVRDNGAEVLTPASKELMVL